MGTLLQDVRYALRHLVRDPLFTVGAVGLLAIGIGVNTAAFTVVDAMLFRPPPWERPEEVVHVYQDSDDGEPSSSSYPATRDMAASEVFAAVAAMTPSTASWEGPDGPVSLNTEYTTASYLEVLGLSVQRGRWFGPEHDLVGSAPVAVVSAPAWRSRFGSDPGIVGRTLRLNGQPVTIIGVGPEKLQGTYAPVLTDLWLSISATPVSGAFQVANLERREDHWYDVRARVAPGVTVEQAQAAMNALANRLAEEHPQLNRGRDITVYASRDVRSHPQFDGRVFLAGWMLLGLVATILVLVCANLANLLLVRGLGRSGEMAVRRALGARVGRVVRLFLAESLLLAALGGLGGALLARWAVAVVPSLPVRLIPFGTLDLTMDARVWAFSLVLVGITGVLFGLAPALRSARTDVAQTLRDDARTASSGRSPNRLRNALVAVQVGTSLVLVIGTALLARSLGALQAVDTGVDADRVAWVRTNVGQAGLGDEDARVALDELLERAAALPGVTVAAASSRLPAQPSGTTTTEVEGYTPSTGTGAVEMPFAVVSDTYFEALGIPLLAGRTFGPDDVMGGGTAIVINETAARRFYADADPIGRRMRGQGSDQWTRTVVGVVGDVPVGAIGESARPMFYFASRQLGFLPSWIVVRTEGDPAAVLPALRRAVPEVRPSLTVSGQGTLDGHFGSSLAAPRFVAGALGAFSLLAVLLAGIGIYAVVSFSVARRAPELGIRMALGAERGGVVRMVVGEVVGTVIVGLAGGLAIAALAAPRLEGTLYGVSVMDPVAFAAAVAFLLLVSGAAAYIPARRAARADPVRALRAS